MKNSKISFSSEKYGLSYAHKATKCSKYPLHSHSGYEILILLDGTVDYFIEGTVYSLEPMDIVVIRHDEMHQIKNLNGENYERIVINIEPAFFKMTGTQAYANILNERVSGEKNLIEASVIKRSNIADILKRIENYISEGESADLVIRCALIEFLHTICGLKRSDRGEIKNIMLKNVLLYINENLTEKISLDTLSEKFYVSKSHLCRVFKGTTGLTMHQYITSKRLLKAHILVQEGMTLSEASLQSGFSDYSLFYKAYKKEFGSSPKKTFNL